MQVEPPDLEKVTQSASSATAMILVIVDATDIIKDFHDQINNPL
jgi:hypothetical protein